MFRFLAAATVAILLAFGGAAITAMSDGHPGLVDIMRHGLIGLLPAISALKMSLNPDESRANSIVPPPDKSTGATA